MSNVLVIGDVMLDCYYWGTVSRISPEAPVPVVNLDDVTYALGGAANVAANVMSLGGEAILMGVTGRDHEAASLKTILRDVGVTDYIVEERDRKTTTKTRVVAAGQHMLRIDNEDTNPLYLKSGNKLRSRMQQVMTDSRAVVISDYAKGTINETMAVDIIHYANGNGVPVFVDPKGNDWAKYANAFCITPNMKEFLEYYNTNYNAEISTVEEIMVVAPEIADHLNLDYLCVTLGAGGILVTGGDANLNIIVLTDEVDVADVSGAGDTVIASFAVDAWSITDPLEIDMVRAAGYANAAAANAVSQVGTVAVSMFEVDYD